MRMNKNAIYIKSKIEREGNGLIVKRGRQRIWLVKMSSIEFMPTSMFKEILTILMTGKQRFTEETVIEEANDLSNYLIQIYQEWESWEESWLKRKLEKTIEGEKFWYETIVRRNHDLWWAYTKQKGFLSNYYVHYIEWIIKFNKLYDKQKIDTEKDLLPNILLEKRRPTTVLAKQEDKSKRFAEYMNKAEEIRLKYFQDKLGKLITKKVYNI